MKNNMYHGEGVYQDDNCTKTGKFEDGKFISGHILFSDGSTFKGQFENGKKTGKGSLRTTDGGVYEGAYKNDVYHGTGFLKTRQYTYHGKFKEGKYHGKGLFIKFKIENDVVTSVLSYYG